MPIQPTPSAQNLPSARVLIIDDDRDWCEAASLRLESEGIDADAVYSGEEASAALLRAHYDAAIVDVHMPDRWGADLVRELRETHGDSLPILIATASDTATGVCAGLLAGADEEFYKGDEEGALIEKLRRLWRTRAH